MSIILTKKSDTASSVPLAADLTNAAGGAELAVNTADKRLYSKTSGGTVVELGTNPSTMSLPNGTANGIPYLNASKVLTSGSALTFDGTNFKTTGYAKAGGFTVAAGTLTAFDAASGGLYGYYSSGGVLASYSDNSGTLSPLNFDGSYLAWRPAGSEQMRLTSTGLGIGTSAPGTALHVQRSSANAVFRLSSSGGSGRDWSINSQTDGHLTIGSDLISGQLDLYAGNLGLGVTPSAWSGYNKALQGQGWAITAPGNDSMQLVSNAYYAAGWKYVGPYAAALYSHINGVHSWNTAPSGTAGNAISFTQAMTLDASGNLGIGTTSPSFKLHVSGGSGGDSLLALTNNTTGVTYRLYNANSGDNGFNGFGIYDGTAYRMIIDSSGNLLVGTTDSSTNQQGYAWNINSGGSFGRIGHANGTASGTAYLAFQYNGGVIGTITQSGTTAVLYNVTSDQRLKENIVDAPEFGSVIDSIKVRSYDWKADGNHQRAGFIAQELVTVAPEAVHQPADPEEMMAVDYSKLVPMLVAEIQSLRKRLAALESK